MALITQEQARRISQAIRSVEERTDAELVTVLARRADDYFYIPALWAALLALVTPLVLTFSPLWLEPMEIFLVQTTVFIVIAGVGRIAPVARRLIPRRVGHYRAQSLARRQFLEQNLHHTRNRLGVLIFVSEMERYVEILADSGVAEHVRNEEWQTIIEEFTHHVRTGEVERGFIQAIERAGGLLQAIAPATGDRNELPDHLVLID